MSRGAHNNEIQGAPQAYLSFIVPGRQRLRRPSRCLPRAPLISMPICGTRQGAGQEHPIRKADAAAQPSKMPE